MEIDTPNVHTPPEGHAPTPPPDPQREHERLQHDLEEAFDEEATPKKPN